MTDMNWMIVCISAFIIIMIIKKASGGGHVIRSALISVTLGGSVLLLVNLTGFFTGVYIPVSRLSLAVSAILGVPGVVSMLILQTFL